MQMERCAIFSRASRVKSEYVCGKTLLSLPDPVVLVICRIRVILT